MFIDTSWSKGDFGYLERILPFAGIYTHLWFLPVSSIGFYFGEWLKRIALSFSNFQVTNMIRETARPCKNNVNNEIWAPSIGQLCLLLNYCKLVWALRKSLSTSRFLYSFQAAATQFQIIVIARVERRIWNTAFVLISRTSIGPF